jgi:hypothetical protein
MHTHNGVFYFESSDAARAYAQENSLPTDRIVEYLLGFAIQLRISGPYAGPTAGTNGKNGKNGGKR